MAKRQGKVRSLDEWIEMGKKLYEHFISSGKPAMSFLEVISFFEEQGDPISWAIAYRLIKIAIAYDRFLARKEGRKPRIGYRKMHLYLLEKEREVFKEAPKVGVGS